jgi:hypothetical protein
MRHFDNLYSSVVVQWNYFRYAQTFCAWRWPISLFEQVICFPVNSPAPCLQQHPTTCPQKPIATVRAACLPSTQVTVTVNGHALQELQHTETDASTGADKGASAFIESVDGAAFAVELDLEDGLKHYFGSVEFAVYIDGEFMGGTVVDLRDGKQNTRVSGVHDNYRSGVTFRRFRFARGEMRMLWCWLVILVAFFRLIKYPI